MMMCQLIKECWRIKWFVQVHTTKICCGSAVGVYVFGSITTHTVSTHIGHIERTPFSKLDGRVGGK